MRIKFLLILFIFGFINIVVAADDVINDDGCVNMDKFNIDWRKYSDIDDKISLQSRSWEAQEYESSRKEIANLKDEIEKLSGYTGPDKDSRLKIINARMDKAKAKLDDWEFRERQRVFIKLGKNCGKATDLKIEMDGPKQINLGETAALSVNVSGGSGQYDYRWLEIKDISGKDAAEYEGKEAMSVGKSKVTYVPAAIGPHRIIVQVSDKNNLSARATAEFIIDVVAAKEIMAVPRKPEPQKDLSLQTLKINGNEPDGVLSFVTQKGKMYVIEFSGVITRTFYNKDGSVLVFTDDPIWRFFSEAGRSPVPEITLRMNGYRIELPYSPNHVYRFDSYGTGQAIKFQFKGTSSDAGSKKEGFFTVKIYNKEDVK